MALGIFLNVVRALDTPYIIDATRAARVWYTVTFSGTVNITTTAAQSGKVFLEFQYPWEIGTSTWNEAAQIGCSTTIGLAIALQMAQTDTKEISAPIPPGCNVRIRKDVTGGMTVAYNKGTEEIY